MHKGALLFLLTLGACHGEQDGVLLWGEASAELAQDWCQVRERCMGLNELDRCFRHNMHHLCELNETCELRVPEVEEAMKSCAEALYAIQDSADPECIKIYFGILPVACDELLSLMPE